MKYSIVALAILLLLGGCEQPQPTVENNTQNAPYVVKQTYLPPPPKKKIKLKEVDDTNFDAAYMYPQDAKKQEASNIPEQMAAAPADTMDKEECIAMITQEKFDQYAAMFGSEAASIKRCKMLKATR
jgi:hypothetical protein